MTISIKYETGKVLDLPYREIIESTVLATPDHEGCPYEAGVDVIPTDNDAIQEISREYRRIDAPTGVLSFPMVDYKSPPDFDRVKKAMEGHFNPEAGELMLGDIMISVDKAEEQAEKYGHSWIRELASLTTHSMLHLFGYGHMENGERLMMEEKQKEILETRGCTR